MIHNLMVNPELYVLTFVTSDNMCFDLIKNCVKHIPNSKKKQIFSDNNDYMYVNHEYYQPVIDNVKDFLKMNASESNVYWANINGILFPCGYCQVAIATTNNKKSNEDEKLLSDIKNYFEKMGSFLKTEVCYPYDYFTKMYCIGLKGTNYEKLLLEFNDFILENGTGPFEKLELVTSYGKLEQRNYPIYTKRK